MKTETTFHLRLSEYRRFSEMMFERTAIRFDMTRYDEVRLFIADRMRVFRMSTYEQYLQYLEEDPSGKEAEIALDRLSREKVMVKS